MNNILKLIETLNSEKTISIEKILSFNIDIKHYEKLIDLLKGRNIEIVGLDGNLKLMTKEEEKLTFLKYKEALENNNKKELKNIEEKIVIKNEGLVRKFAYKYDGYIKENGYDLEDAIQEGRIAIIHAIRKFDINRNIRFSTYATWWIKQYVSRFVLGNNKININIKDAEKSIKIRQYYSECESKGYTGTLKECASKLGIPEEKVKLINNARNPVMSLDVPIKEDNETPILYFIEDKSSDKEYSMLENKIYVKYLMKNVFSILTEKEKNIIFYRYELNGYKYKDYNELASKYNVSRQRISGIELKALEKIRKKLYKVDRFVRIVNKLIRENKTLYLISVEENMTENNLENLLLDKNMLFEIYQNNSDEILKLINKKIKENKLSKIKVIS